MGSHGVDEEPAISHHHLRDYATAVPAALMWAAARTLPPAAASRLGRALLATVGPLLGKQRQVLRNLRLVLPKADKAELKRLSRGVWGNLGAVLFEYPHVARIVDRRVEVRMPPTVRALFEAGRPMVFVTGHLANWELLPDYINRHSPGLVVVYSPDDNPLLERMIQDLRARPGCEYVGKEVALRRLTGRFLHGRAVGLLPDVRVDSAPPLPLFGIDTPTTLSPARLAARLSYPMVPVRAKRLGPARFEIEFEEPIEADAGLTGKPAAMDVMRQFNRRLEAWISERPGEWLCTKRRWPKQPMESGAGPSRC